MGDFYGGRLATNPTGGGSLCYVNWRAMTPLSLPLLYWDNGHIFFCCLWITFRVQTMNAREFKKMPHERGLEA